MSDSVSFDILFKTSSAEADLKKFATSVDRIIGGVEKKFSKLDKVTTRLVKNMRVLGNNKFTGFNKGLQSANKQMAMLEKKMRKINSMSGGGRRGGGGGNRFVSGAMGLMGGVGMYSLMGMVGGIPKAGMEFESKMVDIKGILGITGDAYGKLGLRIKEVGKESTFTITQMAGAAKYMAMAGMKGDAISGSLGSVSNLAMVGGMDVESSADIMTNIMTSMGIDPSKSGQSGAVADSITGVMTKTNVGIQEIGQSMAYVGGIASQTGQTMTETAVAIGILGDNGIKGSRAGTNMRQMFLKLAAPTTKASEMMKNLGVTVTEIGKNGKLKLKPMSELLGEFKDSGAGIAEFKEIFGVRGGAAFSALVGNAEKYNRVLKEIRETGGGVTDRLAEQKMATTAGKTLVMKSNWENLSITLMEKVAPAYNYVLDGMTKLFDKLNNDEDFLQKVEDAANFVAVALRKLYEVLKWVFNLINDNWSTIVMGAGAITTALMGMAAWGAIASLANPFVAWTAAAVGLVVILDQIAQSMPTTDGMKSTLSDRAELFGRGASTLWQGVKESLGMYGTSGGKLGKGLGDMYAAGEFDGSKVTDRLHNPNGLVFDGVAGADTKGAKPKSLHDQMFGGLSEKLKDLIAPKGGDLDNLIKALADIESNTKINLGGGTDTTTKEGDADGTLSSPLTSVANQMSRSVVVNIQNLMNVEHQNINASGSTLSTEDIQTQLAEALIYVVRDTELGLSN